MKTRTLIFRGTRVAALMAAWTVSSAVLAQDYAAAVDEARLVAADAEPGAWMSYGRTYDEQRYSPLDQINQDNVQRLGLAWYAEVDTSRGQEATPIVVDGALYVSTAWSMVYAFDAASGEPLWKYDPEVDREKGRDACCDVVNRGVAVWDGKVFVGTIDGRLVAINAGDGTLAWETMTTDPALPYTITGAPRVIKGLVMIGNGGAEYGVRGYVTAYDAASGEQVWRFHTVPGNPADGYESDVMTAAANTWTGEWWNLGGGGTVWDSMAYDAELDLLYIGVGNGSPWNQTLRSPDGGDNLFLTSIVALDPDDGAYRWHYQTVPGETWDYTATQHIMLADLEIGGEPRRVVMQAPKNGFFYVLDAASGEFISAEPYTPVNWASHIDPESGRPVEMPGARYDRTGEPALVMPGPLGGHNWYPMAFSQRTNLVYIPVTENSLGYVSDAEFVIDPDGWNTGIDFGRGITFMMGLTDAPANAALLKAWDPVSQAEVWRVTHPGGSSAAGVLATAGGLVFQGNRAGELSAFNDATGERLWTSFTQAGVMAAPSTYLVGDEQYLAQLVGSPTLPAEGPGAAVSTTDLSSNNSRLLVYRLDGAASLPEMPDSTLVEASPMELPQTDASNEVIAQGETAYNRNCSVCHGPFAVSIRLDTYPDLRMSEMLGDAEAWHAVVMEGELADAGMASWAGVLDDTDAEAIRAFVITMANLGQ